MARRSIYVGEIAHRTFSHGAHGLRAEPGDLGIHPETARRIDLDRLDNFVLERIPAADGIYCFFGRSRAAPGDERIFVLADARSRSPDDGREAALHVPAFEHAFYEATRALRSIAAARTRPAASRDKRPWFAPPASDERGS